MGDVMEFGNKSLKLIFLFAFMLVKVMYPELTIDFDTAEVKLIKTLEMRFCYISFVEIEGKQYIIKQKKSNCQRKLMGVVRDAVMAHFAEGFIEAHLVGVIAAGKKVNGKPRTDWPATVHTIAPGKMMKEQDSPYNDMDIKQGERGFRRSMLKWMSKHITILKMVAYDTFFCNHDRHRGNLFYQRRIKGSFCAIDMDSAFKYNLSALACKNIKAMLEDDVKFSKKELEVLLEYKRYLQFLIDNFSPKCTLKMYDYFFNKAGFAEGADFYLPIHVLQVQENKRMIARSYEDAKRLVNLIEKIVDRQRHYS